MLKWFKLKMKKFLDIEILENNLKDNYKKLNNRASGLEVNFKLYNERFYNRFDANEYSLKSMQTTLENIVHIGTDVYMEPNGHSWAVVCIEGKVNIVKFVDLDRRDAQDILGFLKHFEAGRHCVDAPYKEMFYEGLFKLK